MSNELKEGVKLRSVVLMPSENGYQGAFAVGSNHPSVTQCESITVTMQPGQMSGVPWAECRFSGRVALVNLANVESVELMEGGS